MEKKILIQEKKKNGLLLFYATKSKPFLDQIVICDEKWIWYNSWRWPAQCLDWEEDPKHCLKPNLHRSKRSWSPFGGLLPVQATPGFWIPLKPLHLRSMVSKPMRCPENCNTCSWHWSTERAQFFFMTVPNHMLHKQCFKNWVNCATKFSLISYIHLTSLQWLPFL